MLEMRLRYPGRETRDRLKEDMSVPGVGRFGIFQWLDGINTMKLRSQQCLGRRQRSRAENQDTLL